MTEHIVDTSVVLAYAFGETGSNVAENLITGAFISNVNFCEIISKLIDHGKSPDDAASTAAEFGLNVVDSDARLAIAAAALRASSRYLGLSLGDRFCLALALQKGLPVYTADKRWAGLSDVVDIRLIR